MNKEKTAGLILESTLRRLVYATQKCFQFPMHAYLRLKGQTLRKAVEELLPEYCSYVFFEDSSENYKKLVEFLKEYFKRSKK